MSMQHFDSICGPICRKALLIAAACCWAAGVPAAAQHGQPLARAARPATLQAPEANTPNAATDVNFPPTPVGQTSTATCASECFSTNGGTSCDGSGTVTQDKALAAPFSVFNFRKTSGTGCSGTSVTLPAHLNTGERLLFDFDFSPTQPGTFSDTEGLGGVTWTLTGSTPSAGSCTANATQLCLNNNRFLVNATWRTPDGQTGTAQMVPLTSDTGYMWFFSAANVEAVIKVLDACGVNNRFWVFAGGLTNVRVIISVTDTMTNVTNQYINPQGAPFQPLQDTNAFVCP
jgi:hypothetical protein